MQHHLHPTCTRTLGGCVGRLLLSGAAMLLLLPDMSRLNLGLAAVDACRPYEYHSQDHLANVTARFGAAWHMAPGSSPPTLTLSTSGDDGSVALAFTATFNSSCTPNDPLLAHAFALEHERTERLGVVLVARHLYFLHAIFTFFTPSLLSSRHLYFLYAHVYFLYAAAFNFGICFPHFLFNERWVALPGPGVFFHSHIVNCRKCCSN